MAQNQLKKKSRDTWDSGDPNWASTKIRSLLNNVQRFQKGI